jgi:hypothetical protein
VERLTALDAMEFMIKNRIPDGVMSFKRDIIGSYIIFIKTLEGTMRAMPGSWIVRGIEGEYYAIKPGIFEKTYIPMRLEI